ncbi:MAG TPA: type VI secretion system membrane subunit TssM [Acetobacteraceae bacterium]|nr:type VI secretion system membrane subunit TssM [Acetobacteraceae bacterium]
MNELPFVLMTLAGRWGASLVGWALTSTLIWYLFPLIPVLNDPVLRIAAIGVALAVCLGVNLVLSWRKRGRERALAKAMTGEGGSGAGGSEAEAAEEVAQLRDRMKQALARLKKGRRGSHVYDQPWYVMIGPPGSGKTTALQNSGLHFPLAEEADASAVAGVGGTRWCDWWFADEAVLIDTAGRYTTQDSDAVIDKAGWLGFLDLLRRARPRQPINGVIVVLSLVDLATTDPASRAAHAASVRRRIDELADRLQLRVPVYLALSKADQLRGFDAYFDDLDAAGRAQVWGMTFALDEGVGAFVREFRLLVGRLEERMVERLQAERAADRRALIGSFPLQVASLEQPLEDFLTKAFSGSKLDPAPLLRGVYMTSATQQGTPIDRLTGMLARTFGVDQKRIPSLRPVSGRAYFVARLLKEVILGEALLVSQPPRIARRRRIARIAGFASVGVATALGGAMLWRASAANRIAIDQENERLASYRQLLTQAPLDPVADDDLARADALLQGAVPPNRAERGWTVALFGLGQEEKLHEVDRLVYARALQRVFLPRLVWRLEQQMRERIGDPNALYETTRVYLMLGSAGPLAPEVVRAWMAADWAARYPGALNAALRERLAAHLWALLSEPLPPVALDGALVETARAVFSRVSVAERVYGRVRGVAMARSIPDWTPAAALGPAGSRLFARRSGKPLTEGIPGFYTGDGFRGALLPALPAATTAVAQESWVLGHAEQIPTEGPQVAALEEAVIALYVADAQARWDALLGDLVLAPSGGRDMTIQDLYVISSPQSPLRELLQAITRALRTDPVPAAKDTPDPARAGKAAPPASTAESVSSPALQGFKAHFQPLFDLVGNGGPAPLDNVLRLVNALQQELAAIGPGAANVPATLQGSGAPVVLLGAEAERQPPPVSGWLRQIATSGNAMLGAAAHAHASAAFTGGDGPEAVCRRVVDGRFPFDVQSSRDAPIDDFVRLFAPGGVLDGYFQSQIKPFVNTSDAVWRPQAVGGVAAPVDAATVATFQRAAAIRDAFFPAAGPPQVRFTLTPLVGAADSEVATLTLGTVSVSTDSARPVQFTWPGSDGASTATLQFGRTGGAPDLQASGPWALFRLIAQARIVTGRGMETPELVFESGAHRASFMLQPGSSHNPFERGLLRGFQCPVVR